ncbi:MAG: putative toxin-antitoxin system toxin component, PIN family [Thermomicrobiales bacterium]
MIRATLDTNVIVSGLAGLDVPTSTPGIIMLQGLSGTFELVISSAILAEVERTLNKPYFRSHSSSELIRGAFVSVVETATFVLPTITVAGIATHTEDDLILATAVSGRVDYLVTGDRMLLQLGEYQGAHLISPRDFLNSLEAYARAQPEWT